MNALANILLGFALLFAFAGIMFVIIPPFAGALFAIAWLTYILARRLKREARAQAVRRQLGG